MAGETALKLDLVTGDIVVENGKLVWIGGADAVRQHLQNRFLTFLGEWFLDTSIGVPWFRDILKKNPTFSLVAAIMKSTILDTPGVIDLIEFNFDYEDNRTLKLDFKCLTDDGMIDFSQLIEV